MAISWYILLRYYGGEPSSDLFQICYDLKKKFHFYYFSSRSNGPSRFLGKPPSVFGKWQRKYFIVTPRSGDWPFPSDGWHYRTVSVPRPSLSLISDEDLSVLYKLSDYVDIDNKKRLFNITNIVRNEKLLYYFGFFNPEEAPSPYDGTVFFLPSYLVIFTAFCLCFKLAF